MNMCSDRIPSPTASPLTFSQPNPPPQLQSSFHQSYPISFSLPTCQHCNENSAIILVCYVIFIHYYSVVVVVMYSVFVIYHYGTIRLPDGARVIACHQDSEGWVSGFNSRRCRARLFFVFSLNAVSVYKELHALPWHSLVVDCSAKNTNYYPPPHTHRGTISLSYFLSGFIYFYLVRRLFFLLLKYNLCNIMHIKNTFFFIVNAIFRCVCILNISMSTFWVSV